MNAKVSAILEIKGNDVVSVAPGDTVAEAVRVMNEHRIGSVMVMDIDKPVGIFTERDVLVRVVAKHKNPAETAVADVMTGSLVAIQPTTTVEEAMFVITKSRCRHLPVLDGNQSVVGMVSSGDLTRWVIRDQKSEIQDLVHYIES